MKPRLIDANALMKYTQNQVSKTIDCNDIARFPTAYNVKSVEEQLENASYRTESSFDEDGYSNDDAEEVVLLEKAIEIVERGGANET